MNTKQQDEIIDRVGADDWDAIIEAFEGGSIEEIKAVLDDMFPSEPEANSELAQMIFDALN